MSSAGSIHGQIGGVRSGAGGHSVLRLRHICPSAAAWRLTDLDHAAVLLHHVVTPAFSAGSLDSCTTRSKVASRLGQWLDH